MKLPFFVCMDVFYFLFLYAFSFTWFAFYQQYLKYITCHLFKTVLAHVYLFCLSMRTLRRPLSHVRKPRVICFSCETTEGLYDAFAFISLKEQHIACLLSAAWTDLTGKCDV